MLALTPDMCISLGISIEVRKYGDMGRRVQGKGDRPQCYKGLKRNNRAGRIKLEEARGMWEGINSTKDLKKKSFGNLLQ